MLYRRRFDVCASSSAGQAGRFRSLSLGDVREIARVRLNGRDLGVRFMPPYDFEIPSGALKATDNLLEVEVTNLGANRLRWNGVNKVDWMYFDDINMIGIGNRPMEPEKWRPLASGLLGPVELRGERAR